VQVWGKTPKGWADLQNQKAHFSISIQPSSECSCWNGSGSGDHDGDGHLERLV
jgi:hypothetical protein